MVVTNTYHKKRNPEADAVRIVDAVLNSSNWDRVYAAIVSCYNGDKPQLMAAVSVEAMGRGYDGSRFIEGLEVIDAEIKAEREKLGDRNTYACDQEAALKDLEAKTKGEASKHMGAPRVIGQGNLESGFLDEAEGRLDAFFGS